MGVEQRYIPSLATHTRYGSESFVKRETSRPAEGAKLTDWIDYFDSNWQKEGLGFNWYTLQHGKQKVGFSLKGQLEGLTDLNSESQVQRLKQRTVQDLLGFKLEYLSDHLIYPRKYHIKEREGEMRLEDPLYGTVEGRPDRAPDVVEVVSEQERNGTVKKALANLKEFFLSDETPDGSIGVMSSLMGETGLKTDDGEKIVYPDSYFFIMKKIRNKQTKEYEVMNYTLKTDFTVEQGKEAVFRLTGTKLPKEATVEDVVMTLAKIKPGDHQEINDVKDVVKILESIKPTYAFKKQRWDEVYDDIETGERLYAFDEKTHNIIDDFKQFCAPGYATKMMYQKGIAATILRMSEAYYDQLDREGRPVTLTQNKWQDIKPVGVQRTFGSVMEEVAKKPGCAGGGSATAVTTAGGERLGVVGRDEHGEISFPCPECKAINVREKGKLLEECQHCNSKKVGCEDEAKKDHKPEIKAEVKAEVSPKKK